MLNEIHCIKEGVTAPDGAVCRAYVRYVPDQEEIYCGLRMADRLRTGPVRIAVESITSALVGVLTLVNYFTSPSHSQGALVIGVLCLLLAAIAVFYGPLSARHLAKKQAAAAREVHLWIGEDFLGFGKTEQTYTRWAYTDFRLLKSENVWVLLQGKDQLVVLPTVAVSPFLAFLEERMNDL